MPSGCSSGALGRAFIVCVHATNAVGLLLLGVWIRKEDYGDSNAIFSAFDRSSDFTGHAERGVIAASVADQDLTLENLRGVPVLLC